MKNELAKKIGNLELEGGDALSDILWDYFVSTMDQVEGTYREKSAAAQRQANAFIQRIIVAIEEEKRASGGRER